MVLLYRPAEPHDGARNRCVYRMHNVKECIHQPSAANLKFTWMVTHITVIIDIIVE